MAADIDIPDDVSDLDGFSERFQKEIFPGAMGFGPRDYWAALKAELKILICGPRLGESDPYSDLRKSIEKHGTRSQLAIVSSIAVFIGAQIGVEAGILVPWIAMFLGLVQKVGTEAFCRALNA